MYFRSVCLFEAWARRSNIRVAICCAEVRKLWLDKSQVAEQYKKNATWQCCQWSRLWEEEHLLSSTRPAPLKPVWSLNWKLICPSLKTGFNLVTTHNIILDKFFMIRSSLAPLVTWPITACLLPRTSSRCSILFTSKLTFEQQESFGVQRCGGSCQREIVQYGELLLLQKVFRFHT